MPVLETEFLLALRESDRNHPSARRILDLASDGKIENLRISGSSILELALGLRGRLSREEIIRSLEIIGGVIAQIEIRDLDLETLIRGLKLDLEKGKHNLFDCLHASTALGHDQIIVSSDSFYDSIAGIRRVDFDELVPARPD